MNYYNEFDPYAAHWLRNLIESGLIPKGDVDDRSIAEVKPSDLDGYAQCHFFAGIAGWSYALQLAGWPTDRPVWTGSCPCQPLSCAGKQAGHEDERHLWPEFLRLIRQCRPATIFGEQVASSLGLEWLDGISLDLEETGYAVAACDIPAASVGAPHIRQRVFWVADAELSTGRVGERITGGLGKKNDQEKDGGDQLTPSTSHCSTTGGVADAEHVRSGAGTGQERQAEVGGDRPAISGVDGLGDTSDTVSQGLYAPRDMELQRRSEQVRPTAEAGFWSNYQLVPCDERITGKGIVPRRVESGIQCLVDGVPFRLADGRTNEETSRAALLKAFGNAIVPQVAAEFIAAYMDIESHTTEEPK